jgi:phytoene dehydrogenase-like protein
VTAPQLYLDLVGPEHLPGRLLDDLRRFEWDGATVKVDWALSGKIPWQQPDTAGAGTVHLGGGLDDLSDFAHQLALRRVSARPFMLVGQSTTADPTRSPAGTEVAWAYTHVPLHPAEDVAGQIRGDWSDPDNRARFVDRMEAQMEAYAPGFRDLVIGRNVEFPGDLEAADANLVGGSVAGGTAAAHQQLVFRPTVGLGRPETPIEGLYLASASAHPGGGVHGAPGSNAALAALRSGTSGRLALALTRALLKPEPRPGLISGDARSVPAGAPGPVTGGGRDVRAGAGSLRSGS